MTFHGDYPDRPEPTSPRAKWARRKRIELALALGGRCRKCGATDDLTFDCIKPKDEGHHKLSSVNRMTFYAREARAGNLALLCNLCNVAKSNKPAEVYAVKKISAQTQRDVEQWRSEWERALTEAWTVARVHVL